VDCNAVLAPPDYGFARAEFLFHGKKKNFKYLIVLVKFKLGLTESGKKSRLKKRKEKNGRQKAKGFPLPLV